MEKTELRKIFKERRTSMTPTEVKEKSLLITKNFIDNFFPQNSKKIFSIYISAGNEVSTEALISFFRKNKITFSFPKITAQNQPLEFILDEEKQDFAPNKIFQNIQEPLAGKKIIPDFLIIPLVAFDEKGSRLGMGKGFFDRTIQSLKQANSQIVTAGLAFDSQRVGGFIPSEKTDQKLDFIITEKNVFSWS